MDFKSDDTRIWLEDADGRRPRFWSLRRRRPMSRERKPTPEELLAVARSYYDRREELVYSVKGNTFLCGGDLTDQEHGGKGRIDCSTLVHLVLQGIPFERSPYVTGDPQDFFTMGAAWADREIAALFQAGMPIRKAHQLARHFWLKGLACSDDRWRSGDIMFFQVAPHRVNFYRSFDIFKAVYHIGIAAEDRDLMYESSGNQTAHVERNYERPGVRLSPILERRRPLFYVRVTSE